MLMAKRSARHADFRNVSQINNQKTDMDLLGIEVLVKYAPFSLITKLVILVHSVSTICVSFLHFTPLSRTPKADFN